MKMVGTSEQHLLNPSDVLSKVTALPEPKQCIVPAHEGEPVSFYCILTAHEAGKWLPKQLVGYGGLLTK